MDTPTRTTNIPNLSALDEVIGNVTQNGVVRTGRQTVEQLAVQLMGTPSFVAGNIVYVATVTQLNAVTPPSETAGAIVLADQTRVGGSAANNGYYTQVTPGVWQRQRGLPDEISVMTNIGGSANEITVDLPLGVDPSFLSLLVFPSPTYTTTDSSVTLALAGGAAESVMSADGTPLDPGDLIAGRSTILFRPTGGGWRHLFPSLNFEVQQTEQNAASAAASAGNAAAAKSDAEDAANAAGVHAQNAANSETAAAALVLAADAGFSGFPDGSIYDFGSVTETVTYFDQDWGLITDPV